MPHIREIVPGAAAAIGRKVIAVDFDLTLCSDTKFGPPNKDVVEAISSWQYDGHFVAVYTARPWSDRALIEAWIRAHGVFVDVIECGKLRFDVLLDDKARQYVA